MKSIEEARATAIKYLKDESLTVVSSGHTEELYVFVFDVPGAETPTPGAPVVTVDKNTGEAEELILPSKEGFEILNSTQFN